MRDRNPATKSKICPECGKRTFRMGITAFIVTHWYCYCQACGYKTDSSVSEQEGSNPWLEAEE